MTFETAITTYALTVLAALIFIIWDTTKTHDVTLGDLPSIILGCLCWPGLFLAMARTWWDYNAPEIAPKVIFRKRGKPTDE